jgi:predicted transcriptional regulator
MLTETQVKIILILLDNKGHAEWELASILEMEDSNLNPILKKLMSMGILCQGEARKSRKIRERKGDYKEFPYYLSNNIDNFKTTLNEIVQSDKILDTGFVLAVIKRTKYLKSLKKKFGEDVTKTISDELRKSYPPYADPRFLVIQQRFQEDGLRLPFLDDDLNEGMAMNLDRGMPSALECWYDEYRHMNRAKKSSGSDLMVQKSEEQHP